MIQPSKLFDNFFDDKNITPNRLGNFAKDTLNNLTANNGSDNFTKLINDLTPLVNNFLAEIGDVDTSLNIQKGTTLTVDGVIDSFKETMSAEEPFIARALGGKNTPAYLEFYPAGIVEYTKAGKTNIPLLTQRVNTAAAAHTAQLGAPLTATLQGFATDYVTARDAQQQQMGTVDANRSERSTNRSALELGLLTTVHTIAATFPGDVQKCLSFFQFNLLFAQTKHKHKLFSGIIAADSTIMVLNRLFTDNTVITLRNTDDNAGFFVWLSATSNNGTVPPEAIELNPGESKQVKPSELGPLTNPFLLIHNSSSVNEGAWQVEVVG